MNIWKTLTLILTAALVIITTIGASHYLRAHHQSNDEEITTYITAVENWLHAEEQMKLAIGTAIKLTKTIPNTTDPTLKTALNDLNTLITLDPPRVPDNITQLSTEEPYNGDHKPLRDYATHHTSQTLIQETELLNNSAKRAQEHARAIGRRIEKIQKLHALNTQ